MTVLAEPGAGGDELRHVAGWDENESLFLNRELSWLAFNARVLELCDEKNVPLLERIGFLAIFARNLDEFFQVRVSGLLDQHAGGVSSLTADQRTPAEQLVEIRRVVSELTARHQRLLVDELRPALHREGIMLSDWDELSHEEQGDLAGRFRERIFPVLTPLAVDPGHPFPYISDLSLNLAVLVRNPAESRTLFARVKVPNTLNRWVQVGEANRFVPLEQVIAAHLGQLFPGMEVVEHHPFRVTRNADFTLEEDEADDLLAAVEFELRRRRFGRATRLEVGGSMSDEVLGLLMRELDLDESAVYAGFAPLDATSLFEIASLDRRELRWPEWSGITEPGLGVADEPADILATMRSRDVLVHHPYSSFSRSVVEFIHQAANDPKVLAIKLTLYRTSGESPIIESLIQAAELGKQVAVLVEVKARFDEAANIGWARRLEQAGVHVAYGLVGLKTHAKVALVLREEGDRIRPYCHLGTGNYNHRTARVYEDLGLLTADPEIGDDMVDLFNFLTGYGRDIGYRKLLVAPAEMRRALTELIDNEVASGRGRMMFKMNSLADTAMIEKLYEASQAGVDIDLVVRGTCCLRPGIPGLSDRIRVRSIVGRYLEHSRLYYFANGAGIEQPVSYIGSADLMPRNLNRRVEVLARIDDPAVQARLDDVRNVVLTDDRIAWTLDSHGEWTQRRGESGVETHTRMQHLARARAES